MLNHFIALFACMFFIPIAHSKLLETLDGKVLCHNENKKCYLRVNAGTLSEVQYLLKSRGLNSDYDLSKYNHLNLEIVGLKKKKNFEVISFRPSIKPLRNIHIKDLAQ